MTERFDETTGDGVNDNHEPSAPELTAEEAALLNEMPSLREVGPTRREFLARSIGGGIGLFALDLITVEKSLLAMSPRPGAVHAASAARSPRSKVSRKVTVCTRCRLRSSSTTDSSAATARRARSARCDVYGRA